MRRNHFFLSSRAEQSNYKQYYIWIYSVILQNSLELVAQNNLEKLSWAFVFGIFMESSRPNLKLEIKRTEVMIGS